MKAPMNAPDHSNDWVALVQAGRLSDAEITALRQRLQQSGAPGELADFESELALNAALGSRPLPKPSSNFNARLWAEIDHLEQADVRANQTTRQGRTKFEVSLRFVWRWLSAFRAGPAMALATVLVASGLGWSQFTTHRRTQLASNVSEITRTTPDVDVLRDFESIRAMAVKPEPGDLALIAALEATSATH
jgi:hypothetical protein